MPFFRKERPNERSVFYPASYAHLTLGMESKDGMSAADILHVRAGQNYLVEDFTCMERLRSDPVVLESLSRVAKEIGFDRVRPYVMENGSYKAMPDRASFYGKRRLIIPESPSYRNNHVDPDGKFKWAYDAEERYMRKEVKRWRLRVSFW